MSTSRTDNHLRPADAHSSRRAQRRADKVLQLQRQRQEPLPGWLATRASRRALALLPVLTLALGVVAATADGGAQTALLIGLTSLLGSCAIAALRRVTGMLDKAPDHLLDERELGDRDHGYRQGFRLSLLLLGVLALIAVVNGFSIQETGTVLVDGVGWVALMFAAFWTAGMLPTAALAWNWRSPLKEAGDLDDEDS